MPTNSADPDQILRETNGSGRFAITDKRIPEKSVELRADQSERRANGNPMEMTEGMETAFLAAEEARAQHVAAQLAYQFQVGEALEAFVEKNWPGAAKVAFEYDPDNPTDIPNVRGVFDVHGEQINPDNQHQLMTTLNRFAATIDGPAEEGELIEHDDQDFYGYGDSDEYRNYAFTLGAWRKRF